MAAFTGSQPIGTVATATTFTLANTASFLSFKNLLTHSSAVYTFFPTNYLGDAPTTGPINTRPITSINAKAYTTYPKMP
jgi:hypothetical protein